MTISQENIAKLRKLGNDPTMSAHERVWLLELVDGFEAIQTAVQDLRAPGEMLGSETTTPHPECEAICTEVIATVLEHVLGDCDPATCLSDEHQR